MKQILKIAISFLITSIATALFIIFAFSGLFNWIEANFYNPRLQEQYQKQTESIAAEIKERYYKPYFDRFGAFTKNDFAATAFLQDQSQLSADVQQRNEGLKNYQNEFQYFLFTRFIDSRGKIHYSNLDTDLKQKSQTRIIYHDYDKVEETIQFEDLLVLQEQSPRLTIDGTKERFIFRIPIIDKFDIYKGTALFYLGMQDLSNFLITLPSFTISAEIALLDNLGVIINYPHSEIDDIAEVVKGEWQSAAKIPMLPARINITEGTENEKKVFQLFTADTGIYGLIGMTIDQSEFEIRYSFKIILLVLSSLSLFLLIYFILNLKQDPLVVIAHRIKQLEIRILKEFVETKKSIDWEKWHRELIQKSTKIKSKIKEGVRYNKKYKDDIDELIDKSWDEILSVIADRKETSRTGTIDITRIEELISTALQNNRIVIATDNIVQARQVERIVDQSAVVESPVEAEEVETLDEIEEAEAIQTLEKIEEAEAGESLEEVAEAEAIESLEEVEEAEAGESPEEVAGADAGESLEKAEEAEAVESLEELEEVETTDPESRRLKKYADVNKKKLDELYLDTQIKDKLRDLFDKVDDDIKKGRDKDKSEKVIVETEEHDELREAGEKLENIQADKSGDRVELTAEEELVELAREERKITAEGETLEYLSLVDEITPLPPLDYEELEELEIEEDVEELSPVAEINALPALEYEELEELIIIENGERIEEKVMKEEKKQEDFDELEEIAEVEEIGEVEEAVEISELKGEVDNPVVTEEILEYTIDDLKEKIIKIRDSVVIEDGVFRIKDDLYQKGGTTVEKERFRSEHSDENFISRFRKIKTDKKIYFSDKGLEFDDFLQDNDSPDDIIQQLKSLVDFSRKINAVSVAILACDKKNNYVLELSIGLIEKSKELLFFKKEHSFVKKYFTKNRIAVISRQALKVEELKEKFAEEDLRYIKSSVFIPAVYNGKKAVFYIAFPYEKNISIIEIIGKLNIFLKAESSEFLAQ